MHDDYKHDDYKYECKDRHNPQGYYDYQLEREKHWKRHHTWKKNAYYW
jgi:hypothetical protein